MYIRIYDNVQLFSPDAACYMILTAYSGYHVSCCNW